MIEVVEISNFKGFSNLVLENLNTVNVITGQNNAGKTSLLEAIFMFYDRGNPDIHLRPHASRGIQAFEMTAESMWGGLFNDFDFDKKITISITENKKKDRMECIYRSRGNFSATSQIYSTQNYTSSNTYISSEALQISYHSHKNKPMGEIDVYFAKGQAQANFKNVVEIKKQAVSVTPSKSTNLQFFGIIDRFKKMDLLIDCLKIIEPEISSVSAVPTSAGVSLYVDVGKKIKIPISYLGDGVSKMLSIASAIIANPDSIVLIDEMENGIYYQHFPNMWEILIHIAHLNRSQLFITTHSYDSMTGLAKCLEKKGDLFNQDLFSIDNDLISFYRLVKKNHGIVAKYYESSDFLSAINMGWELR